MLDAYANNEININAISGTITKNYAKSYFERFHLKSHRSGSLLSLGSETVVLQMMVCGDMEVIAELISLKDFQESFGGLK